MIDPKMMMGQMPNVPSQEELWKNEKSKYRQWIILFGISILIIFVIYFIGFILNVVYSAENKANIADYILDKQANVSLSEAQSTADNYVLYQLQIIPAFISAMLLTALGVYLFGVFNSYKAKSFAKLYVYPSFIIGFGALIGAYQIISQFIYGSLDFQTKGGIYHFISTILFPVVWLVVSRPVSRIRYAFFLSKKVNDIKNSPEYIQMQRQINEAMKNNPGIPLGMFGPMSTPQAETPPADEDVAAITTQEIKMIEEQNKLEQMSVADLKAVASKLSISGAEGMSKTELISNILRVSKIEDTAISSNAIELKRKTELSNMPLDDLKIIASKLSISGIETMTKDELVNSIVRASNVADNTSATKKSHAKNKTNKPKDGKDNDLNQK